MSANDPSINPALDALLLRCVTPVWVECVRRLENKTQRGVTASPPDGQTPEQFFWRYHRFTKGACQLLPSEKRALLAALPTLRQMAEKLIARRAENPA